MTAKTTKLMSSPLAWIALGSAFCAVIASFGVLLSATDPKILVASAELDATNALARGNYSWARIEIKDRIAYLKGEAPGEPERIMAFESVRKALQSALRDGYVIDGLRSQLTLVAAAPPPANFAEAKTVPEPSPVAVAKAPEPARTPEPTWTTTVAAVTTPGTTWNATPLPVINTAVVIMPTTTTVAGAQTQPSTSSIETASVEKTPATDCKTDISETLTHSKIAFGSDSDQISNESSPTLDALAQIAKRCAAFKLTIEGHTDNTGKNLRNLSLSQRRAVAVRDALVRRGVVKDRLRAVGLGARRPIAKGEDEASRSKNRRIEITLTEINATKSASKH